jgi:2',3'-cyclic-nucleotide 2'-phosphodiesterase
MDSNSLRVLCFGDVVGRPGRMALKSQLARLRELHQADLVIANGENAAGGTGIDTKTAREIFAAGVDVITLGDHTWQRKEFLPFLDQEKERVIRPANYPAGAAGRGWTIVHRAGVSIGIFNLIGRVFTGQLVDCPFNKAEELINGPLKDCRIIIADMHAEATSEKIALGRVLDGKISCLFGTHTHVQTADAEILPGGTAYVSDLGMTGPREGVIGMDAEVAIKRFRTGLSHAYQISKGAQIISGISLVLSLETGRAKKITLIRELLDATPQ